MLNDGEILDGRYQILREIGKGGTGIIYLGYHLTLCKYVVVKKIKDHFVGNINERSEADILKKLHHRYLPQVYDFLMVGTGVYTVMDYVDGHDLSWYVENGYLFTEEQLTVMLCQLCEVLDYLHRQRPPIIHSDIKPGNIMLRSDGDLCLIDFNISLDGQEEKKVIGYSAGFASPEQVAISRAELYGEKNIKFRLDPRTDIYSLGVSFYYLMTGVVPDCGRKAVPAEKLQNVYSAALSKVVAKAMEPSRQKRYSSAAKMLLDLQHGNRKLKMLLAALLGLLAVLLISAGTAGGYRYISQKRSHAFTEAFLEFQESMEEGDEVKMRERGLSLLNDGQLQKELKIHQEQKAAILSGMGDSYYQEENYSAAVIYYKEALSCSISGKQMESCTRDYILSLVKAGRTESAKRELEERRKFFSSAVLHYLEAELLLEEGEREEAFQLLTQVLAESTDREIRGRCCLQAADCLQGAGREEERLDLLIQARQLLTGRLLLRRIAEGCVEIAQNGIDRELKRKALTQAQECYVHLCRDGNGSYLDRLNQATVLEMCGDFEGALVVLRQLETDYPQDYRAYRAQAFLCYQIERQKEADKRDYQGVIFYGKKALALCTDSQKEEEQMVQLKELMRQLDD